MDQKILATIGKVGAAALGVFIFSFAVVLYVVPRHVDRAAVGAPCATDADCASDEICAKGSCFFAGTSSCVPGLGCSVPNALGACAQGLITCDPNGNNICTQTVHPKDEACNGIDDNCDGIVDNNLVNNGIPCDTGLGGTCSAGITVCSNGSIVCNALDSQCNTTTVCGDSVCSTGETAASCPLDCSASSCHDKCTAGTALNPSCTDTCVQQICNADTYCCAVAWDATCVSEVQTVCGTTCGTPAVCGDGTCGVGEDISCPQDCGTGFCGDTVCDKNESPATCPFDCSSSFCGDGVCDPNETFANCSLDCSCKDNADCAAPTPVCDATNKQCVQCLANSDCGIGAQCQNGTCNAVTPCTCQSVVESITTWKNAGMKKAALKQCAELVKLDDSSKNTGKACNAKCKALNSISRKLPAADRKKIQDFCGMVTAQVKNKILCVANQATCTK